MDNRLRQARQRLFAALEAGEDTTPHRHAVALLERDVAAEHRRQQETTAQAEQVVQAGIATRAAAIAADVRQRVAVVVEKFPIPAGIVIYDQS